MSCIHMVSEPTKAIVVDFFFNIGKLYTHQVGPEPTNLPFIWQALVRGGCAS